jgi:hypothetical protein
MIPAHAGNEVSLSAGEKKRIAASPEALIFYTNTDESNYPIYVAADREIWLKARPHIVVKETEWTTKRDYNIPVAAVFFVKNITEVNEDIKHSLFNDAVRGIEEVAKKNAVVTRLQIEYEIYKGDMEQLLGEVKAYCIKIASCETPFSGVKYSGRKAWAIGYDWLKRIKAKYPQLNSYIYIDGEDGSKGRSYVTIKVKLPIPTPEFVKLFNKALAIKSIEEEQFDKQIEELEKIIREKEKELTELKIQLEELKRKREIPGRIVSVVK